MSGFCANISESDISESANSILTFIEHYSDDYPCVKSDCFYIGPFMVQDSFVDLSAESTSR